MIQIAYEPDFGATGRIAYAAGHGVAARQSRELAANRALEQALQAERIQANAAQAALDRALRERMQGQLIEHYQTSDAAARQDRAALAALQHQWGQQDILLTAGLNQNAAAASQVMQREDKALGSWVGLQLKTNDKFRQMMAEYAAEPQQIMMDDTLTDANKTQAIEAWRNDSRFRYLPYYEAEQKGQTIDDFVQHSVREAHGGIFWQQPDGTFEYRPQKPDSPMIRIAPSEIINKRVEIEKTIADQAIDILKSSYKDGSVGMSLVQANEIARNIYAPLLRQIELLDKLQYLDVDTAPVGFERVWPTLDVEDRIAVLEVLARSAGTVSPETILRLIQQG